MQTLQRQVSFFFDLLFFILIHSYTEMCNFFQKMLTKYYVQLYSSFLHLNEIIASSKKLLLLNLEKLNIA